MLRSLAICFSLLLSAVVAAQQPKLGDIPDGNRAAPVHRIPLYDETGSIILPDDQPVMPFSTRETCNPCHDYNTIASGLHFNYAADSIQSGRIGEPWILTDPLTATQIPLSYRDWPGIWSPGELGLNNWEFIRLFGRHLPGGGVGEAEELDPPELAFRRLVSGKLEINCFACHNRESGQDQAEYASQVARENFRWAATGACSFAQVYGSAKQMPDNYDIYAGVYPDNPQKQAPTVEYDRDRFNRKNQVALDLSRNIPNERCYFCHSTRYIEKGNNGLTGFVEEDVHLQAGLSCVDCHHNGLDHNMIRGYEWEPVPHSGSFTCAGCHLQKAPEGGRLGAPRPGHAGIPIIHFEKLTCTACHTGPMPGKQTQIAKTSRANALGTYEVSRVPESLPLLAAPVFVKNEQNKIEPRRLLWPSFWAYMDSSGVHPLLPEKVSGLVQEVILADTLKDSTNLARVAQKQWPQLSEKQIADVLNRLARRDSTGGTPVFVSGGKLHRLETDSTLSQETHPAAAAVTWPIAHDVRPAAQSLGANGCQDCHRVDSPFYFGQVTVYTPISSEVGQTVSMATFHKEGVYLPRAFAISFFFRPWFKFLLLASCVLLGGILLNYFLRGLEAILRMLSE